MNELQDLIDTARTHGETVLATVVETQGSVYRRPGARLLVGAGLPLTGAVSGGCLEADVAEHARDVDRPTILKYDTTDEMLGLGCHGVVTLLVEPTPGPLLEYVDLCLSERQEGVIATVYRGPETGRRYYGPNLPPVLRQAHERGAQHWHDNEQSVLLETITPPTSLVICGGGPDAVPVARLALELGWRVNVVDHRPDAGRFPLPTQQHLPSLDANTVALVMSHNLVKDEAYLQQLLPTPVAYIGMLGPRQRTRQLLEKHHALHDPRLHYPVGLDIGAETPQSIALAMLAEITAVLSDRTGGFLKDRPGPIHAQPARLQPVA